MISAIVNVFLWLIGKFMPKPKAEAQQAVDVESKIARDAANPPSDADASRRLRDGRA